MTPETLNNLSKNGWPDSTLLAVDSFLTSSNGIYQFHNLANIGGGDYRLMYKEKIGVDAKGNPITKMQGRLGKIIK
jgi:hypothetical protein